MYLRAYLELTYTWHTSESVKRRDLCNHSKKLARGKEYFSPRRQSREKSEFS